MRLPWKKSKASRLKAVHELKDAASFGGDLEDFTVLRHHAVRALCGALMDRHTACRSPHPFCGQPGHQQWDEFSTLSFRVRGARRIIEAGREQDALRLIAASPKMQELKPRAVALLKALSP